MTTRTSGPVVLAGVDRAAFAVALGGRVRAAGATVSMTNISTLTNALSTVRLDRREQLYWLCRTTLVSRYEDLALFDQVFTSVFDEVALAIDPHARRSGLPPKGDLALTNAPSTTRADEAESSPSSLPWATLPMMSIVDDERDDGSENELPELRASAVASIADMPFDDLDADQITALAEWLQRNAPNWPRRRSRRFGPDDTGRRIALRRTLARSRRTGFEPVELLRDEPRQRLRRVVIIVDVSESMRPYSTALLTLMRVVVRSVDSEVFAFSSSPTRLTHQLAHHSVAEAIDLATDVVTDRFGGTRIATSLRTLLASRPGNALRGAVVVIASDGWDSDPPELLGRVMTRLHRRAHRVIWMNPRAGSPEFEPSVGAMAAALPFCDDFLPAHTFASVLAVMEAIAGS